MATDGETDLSNKVVYSCLSRLAVLHENFAAESHQERMSLEKYLTCSCY